MFLSRANCMIVFTNAGGCKVFSNIIRVRVILFPETIVSSAGIFYMVNGATNITLKDVYHTVLDN